MKLKSKKLSKSKKISRKRGFEKKQKQKTKDQLKDQYSKNDRHKMIHTLLLCHNPFWKDLQYVKSRTPHERIEHYSQCDD